MPSELNYRQRLFVEAYLGKANGSAAEAARMARYAEPETQGPRLLRNVQIRAQIDARLAEAAMPANEVLARLSDMASVDLSDFVNISKGEAPKISLWRARTKGKTHLLKKFKNTKYGLAIELTDALSALEKLGRYHKLFGEAEAQANKFDDAVERAQVEYGRRNPGPGDDAGGVP